MSCKNCDEKNEGQEGVAYYRWKNGNVGVMGCDEHLREVFAALDADIKWSFDMPERAQALGFTIEDRDRLLRLEIAVQSIQTAIKALVLNGENVAPAAKKPVEEDGGWEEMDASNIPFWLV